MIYVFDDSFSFESYKFDLAFINDKANIRMITSCQVSSINSILQEMQLQLPKTVLIIHKSFKFCNHLEELIVENRNVSTRDNFIATVRKYDIQVVSISGSCQNNSEAKTIEKKLFYENFASFYNYYKLQGSFDYSLLYTGNKVLQRKPVNNNTDLSDKIDRTNDLNDLLPDLVPIFGQTKANKLIQTWILRNTPKDDIKKLINSRVK